jgi:hypothetical protein
MPVYNLSTQETEEDDGEFEASLVYKVRLSLKRKKNQLFVSFALFLKVSVIPALVLLPPINFGFGLLLSFQVFEMHL